MKLEEFGSRRAGVPRSTREEVQCWVVVDEWWVVGGGPRDYVYKYYIYIYHLCSCHIIMGYKN